VSDIAIRVDDARITYRVRSDAATRQRRIPTPWARDHTTVDAVRGVSFEVMQGQVVGLIGDNGSGKSSLMRAIAGLQSVDSGTILVRGEPSLLGVGAVLDRDLSGARNIMMGCMALGMTRREAREQFASIVEFAGLEDAINRPLRTYSSGMKQRLQFAIATTVDPDVLLVDEALAVGDREFRRRSRRRIKDLKRGANTVLIVSHSLGVIRKVCNRVLWMDAGRIVMDGKPKLVIRAYKQASRSDDDGLS
jgi:teichoic acid transport system ATP-binding protein